MIPTLQFRWYSTRNEVTAEMVKAEQKRTDDSMMECKKRLIAETKPVLQQFFDTSGPNCPDEFLADGGVWKDIELVVNVTPAPGAKKTPKP